MKYHSQTTPTVSGTRPPHSEIRSGFTLIELLVVIAIIAILVALTAAAVFQVSRQASTAETRNEISQFDNALSAARLALGVDYLPSRLVLKETISDYNTADLVEANSLAILQKAFGRRFTTADWNGDGTPGSGTWTLGPDQTLVFWLGGIPDPTNNGSVGFSTSPTNPGAAGGTRKGPFFEFKANRLIRSTNGFFVYTDAYGVRAPYLYFSSGRAGNDYITPMPYQTTQDSLFTITYPVGHANAGSNVRVLPYFEGSRFLNATGHQIISAGRNGLFGPGLNSWAASSGILPAGTNLSTTPTPEAVTAAQVDAAKDDLANFSRSVLGGPQN